MFLLLPSFLFDSELTPQKFKNSRCEISESLRIYEILIFCKNKKIADIPEIVITIGEFRTATAKHQRKFENKSAKMRTCLMKFS